MSSSSLFIFMESSSSNSYNATCRGKIMQRIDSKQWGAVAMQILCANDGKKAYKVNLASKF